MSTTNRWSFLNRFTEVDIPEASFPKQEFLDGSIFEDDFQDYLFNDSVGGPVLCLWSGNRAGVVLRLDADDECRRLWHRFALASAEHVLLFWEQYYPQENVLRQALETKKRWLEGSASEADREQAERHVERFQKKHPHGLTWRTAEVVRHCCQRDPSDAARAGQEATELPLAFRSDAGPWMEQSLIGLLIELLENRKAAQANFSDWQQTALTALKRRRTLVAKEIEKDVPPLLWCSGDHIPDGNLVETLCDAAPVGGKRLFLYDGTVGEVLDWEKLLYRFRLDAVEPLVKYWEAEFPTQKQVPRAIATFKRWLSGKATDKQLLAARRMCERSFQRFMKDGQPAKSRTDSPERTAALAVGFAAMHLGPSLDSLPAYVLFILNDAQEMLEDAANGVLPAPPPENETPEEAVRRCDANIERALRRLQPAEYSAYRRELVRWLISKTLQKLEKVKSPSRIQRAARTKLREELKGIAR